MAKKNQERKKKERERRVAQKKIADAAKRMQERTAKQADKAPPKTSKTFTAETLLKRNQVASSKKTPFTHRRSGG
ncbi:MAG: hypothetical protein AB7U20_09585 [Planctomycetaceae bacterium]